MQMLYWIDLAALVIGYGVMALVVMLVLLVLFVILRDVVNTFRHVHAMFQHRHIVFRDPGKPPGYWRIWRWVFTDRPQFNLSSDECLNWPAKIAPRRVWPG